MPRKSADKALLQRLALWLLPQYLDAPGTDLRKLALTFGESLIYKFGMQELRKWVTAMQYVLADIEGTKE